MALAAGVIVHMITYIIPSAYIDDQQYTEMGTGSKLALALLPNINLWWGIKILVSLSYCFSKTIFNCVFYFKSVEEGKGAGVQWTNLDDRSQPDDPVTFGVVLLMFFADMLLYGLITWYVDGIKPGKHGVAQKWYFPVQPSYWRPSKGKHEDSTGLPTPS